MQVCVFFSVMCCISFDYYNSLSKEDFQKIAFQKGGACLSKVYSGLEEKLKTEMN